MELQTFAHQHELYGCSNKDLYNLIQSNWSYGVDNYDLGGTFEKNSSENLEEKTTDEELSATYQMAPELDQWGRYAAASELEISCTNVHDEFPVMDPSTIASTRSRRRRSRTKKNQEEIENQRMAHIAVERNRRKQMNEYLSVLRGLMPDYYVLKADQASIVGGAINYVKELEQQLQFLGSLTHVNQTYEAGSSSSPFSEFFTFPQYSTSCDQNVMALSDPMYDPFMRQNRYAAADIEVTMVENHANLKVRSQRRPRQLLKMVSGLQNLRLTVLHLNVTTVDQVVLYSLSLKVEDDCSLTSVDDIAAAVNQVLRRIQEESCLI